MLRALVSFPYAGHTLQPGECFEAESKFDHDLLVLARRAEDVADDAADDDSQHPPAKRSKRYLRRDMRATEA